MSGVRELSNLSGRRALVTGAGGVLGKVIASTLNELGADLILVDRPGSDLESVAQKLIKESPAPAANIEVRTCDLENETDRKTLIDAIAADERNLNLLINNAAFVGDSKLTGWVSPFEEQTVETWRRALEVNLTAIFHLCQGFTPVLKGSQGAAIVNIASLYGFCGPDWRIYEGTAMGNPAAYAASKGGVIQLTRWLATTLAPEIRVNAISPGGFFRNQPEVFVERYRERTPLRRMAEEDDLRGAVAYLSSDLSAYVTGQNLALDGGWSIW